MFSHTLISNAWAQAATLEHSESLPPIFIILFFLAFPLMWIGMSNFIAYSGWKNLAGKYAANGRKLSFAGKIMTSGRVGWARYRGALFVGAHEDGLWMSVNPLFAFGHKPLIIPWEELHPSSEKSLLASYVSFTVEGTRIALHESVWNKVVPR